MRQSFLIRLSGEYTRLMALAGALRSGVAAPETFGDLEGFAHRLRGAAAVFDFPVLREAAEALELAANDALVGPVAVDESRLQKAIRDLEARLACLTGSTPPTDATTAPVTSN